MVKQEAKALNEVKWEERERLFTKEVSFTEGFTHKIRPSNFLTKGCLGRKDHEERL